MTYHSPDRNTWGAYLRGASFSDMTEPARVAKRPVYMGADFDIHFLRENTEDFYMGAGGKLILSENVPVAMEYGDKNASDNAIVLQYMANLEFAMYDALRKPGISVQRAGTDVVVILVRDAIMELNAPEISATGDDTLRTIAKILNKYDATFIEIAGYTDAMNAGQARALSMDMAERVGVYLAQHKVNTARMFIVARGASRPIAAQDDVGRLTNRRIEIRIAPAR